MRNRKTYTGEFKVKVVVEAIRGDRKLSQIADRYQLHPNQIKNWKSIMLREAVHVMEDKRRKKSS